MIYKNLKSSLLYLSLAMFTTTLYGENLSVDQIINKAEQVAYYQGVDGSAVVNMENSDGRTRNFVILRKNFGRDQKFYVYFKRPSDLKDTTFLVHKNTTKEDDRWLFLPSLSLVKRIASGDKRTSFVGSNFYYEDISGRNPNLDNHSIHSQDAKSYVIKSIPKDTKNLDFNYYLTTIDKTNFVVLKTSYFNDKNQEYRVYEALEVKKVGEYHVVSKAVMKDLIANSSTTLSYSKLNFDIGLPEDIFTERYLKNPPKKYLN
jgi:hypothetical protein